MSGHGRSDSGPHASNASGEGPSSNQHDATKASGHRRTPSEVAIDLKNSKRAPIVKEINHHKRTFSKVSKTSESSPTPEIDLSMLPYSGEVDSSTWNAKEFHNRTVWYLKEIPPLLEALKQETESKEHVKVEERFKRPKFFVGFFNVALIYKSLKFDDTVDKLQNNKEYFKNHVWQHAKRFHDMLKHCYDSAKVTLKYFREFVAFMASNNRPDPVFINNQEMKENTLEACIDMLYEDIAQATEKLLDPTVVALENAASALLPQESRIKRVKLMEELKFEVESERQQSPSPSAADLARGPGP